jgi:hypothetical protein
MGRDPLGLRQPPAFLPGSQGMEGDGGRVAPEKKPNGQPRARPAWGRRHEPTKRGSPPAQPSGRLGRRKATSRGHGESSRQRALSNAEPKRRRRGGSGAKRGKGTSPSTTRRQCRPPLGACRGTTATPWEMRNSQASGMPPPVALARIRGLAPRGGRGPKPMGRPAGSRRSLLQASAAAPTAPLIAKPSSRPGAQNSARRLCLPHPCVHVLPALPPKHAPHRARKSRAP